MEHIQWLNDLLGLDVDKPEPMHMMLRAFIVFFVALIFIRIAGVRTLGKQSPFDHLTILILGAVMGRAIVTNQSFEGSILAALVIMILHRIISWITFNSKSAGKVFKGEPLVLFRDGKFIRTNMQKTSITEEDIKEAMHEEINSDDVNDAKEIFIERSGHISVTKEEK